MTTPELTDEQLLLAWQELTKEQQRRFDRLFDTDQAVRIRCILDELGGEPEAEYEQINFKNGEVQESNTTAGDRVRSRLRGSVPRSGLGVPGR